MRFSHLLENLLYEISCHNSGDQFQEKKHPLQIPDALS